MTNDREEICEQKSQLRENFFHMSLHFLFLHIMSLNIDMKMILPVKFSGSHCRSFINS